MHFKNEQETREAIDEWRSKSEDAQLSRLRKAKEAMELDLMYYDQKGSNRGTERCEKCLTLISQRIEELENSQT